VINQSQSRRWLVGSYINPAKGEKKEKRGERPIKKEEKLVQSKHTHLHTFDHPVQREREIIRVKKKNSINWCFLLRI
jgi:hypothetical protein